MRVSYWSTIFAWQYVDGYLLFYGFFLIMQCGVIECVPNSKSRDQLGKQTLVSLKQYFHSVYGGEESVSFQDVSCLCISDSSCASFLLYGCLLLMHQSNNSTLSVQLAKVLLSS